jgi:3-isopropylmalate dehydrogenase
VGDRHAYAEATHGTAPDIAGKGIANPVSLILSVQMLLGWIGDRRSDRALTAAAQKVEAAVTSILEGGRIRTPDLGGTSSTREFGDAIADKVKAL